MTNRYDNGSTKQQQLAYNTAYRQRQARYRGWLDSIAEDLGLTRDQLATSRNAAIAAEALRAAIQNEHQGGKHSDR